MSCVDRFFDRHLCNLVIKLKIPIIIIAVIWLGISIWRFSLLKSVSYSEQFFSSNHPVQKILNLKQNSLYNDEMINVNFYFGVKDHLTKFKNVTKWNN